jgi:hypothetical protein
MEWTDFAWSPARSTPVVSSRSRTFAWPGQIRVTLVREPRAVDNARRERASERSSTTTHSEVLAATARAALPCRQATRPTRRLSARPLWSPKLQRPRRLPEARPLAWVAHDTAARRDEAR